MYYTSRTCLSSIIISLPISFFFFFNDTATTEIYTLSYTTLFRSASDAGGNGRHGAPVRGAGARSDAGRPRARPNRSEEHTSELQSRLHLVCRLLLEKKKNSENFCCCCVKCHEGHDACYA